MTVRYYYPCREYYSTGERRMTIENPKLFWYAVEQLRVKGAHILECIIPPPGQDDRTDDEHVEIVDGEKCYVSRIKYGGKWFDQYRFTVFGWEEVISLGLAETRRMIRGRNAPYTHGEIDT